jgi:hypothetical protein
MNQIELPFYIIGFTQMIKVAGLPSKFLPFMAVLLGGLFNLAIHTVLDPQVFIEGLIVGVVTTMSVDFINQFRK